MGNYLTNLKPKQEKLTHEPTVRRYIPPLPGVQSNWRRIGVAAKYYPQQKILTSGFRFVVEEQMYNDGYRYRIQDNEEIAPIRLGWHQVKVQDNQVLKVRNEQRDGGVPRFFRIKLDMHTNFDENYRPANIFGDSPMNNSRYRSSNVSMPVRKQV